MPLRRIEEVIASELQQTQLSPGETGSAITARVLVDEQNNVIARARNGKLVVTNNSPSAERSKAVDGSNIVVGAGTWDVNLNMALPGGTIHYHLEAGSVLRMNTTDLNMFDDQNLATVLKISGAGEIHYTTSTGSFAAGTGAIFKEQHASSVFTIDAAISIKYLSTSDQAPTCVFHASGTWLFKGTEILLGGVDGGKARGVFWAKGPHHTECLRCIPAAEDEGGVGYNFWAEGAGTTLGDTNGEMSVVCPLIVASDILSSDVAPVATFGNLNSRVWVTTQTIVNAVDDQASDDISEILANSIYTEGCYLYVSGAQKITGKIAVNGGTVYVDTQKLALGAQGVCLLYLAAGTSRIRIGELNDANMVVSASALGSVRVTGGTHYLEIGDATKTVVGHGIHVEGGTLTLQGSPTIKTTPSTSLYNPVYLTGGTFINKGATTLVSGGAQKSVEAGTAQTMKNQGTLAVNIDKGANVTMTPAGTKVVDTATA